MSPACRAPPPAFKFGSVQVSVSIDPQAFRAPAFGGFRAAGHIDALSIDERIGYLPVGLMQIPPCCLAGDSLPLCSCLLLKAFQVYKAEQFDVIRREGNALTRLFPAGGLVTPAVGISRDRAAQAGPSPPGASAGFRLFCTHRVS